MLGVFDSGFGGLTVLSAIRERLPHHAIMYLGDSGRVPYGDRSREVITTFVKECCSLLFERGCPLIVLACNAASAETLRELQREWLPAMRGNTKSEMLRQGSAQVRNPKNIIGVVRPLAEEAAERTKTGRIAVVGTRSTIASGAYEEELRKLRPAATVITQACPLLVPLIEEGLERKPETRKILRTYLRPVKAANPDVLILGCTHYEVLFPAFVRMMGKRCTVLRSSSVVAAKLSDYLQRHPEYDSAIARTGEITFLTTGDSERFQEVGSRFYGKRMETVERVEV